MNDTTTPDFPAPGSINWDEMIEASNDLGFLLSQAVTRLRAVEAEKTGLNKLETDIRESIASFLPADANIHERPTLDALNMVFREVMAWRKNTGNAQSSLAASAARVAELEGVLREVEWNGRRKDGLACCPACGGWSWFGTSRQHKSDCLLDSAIRAGAGREG